MEAGTVRRIDLLGVPVDECDLEGVLKTLEGFLTDGRRHQIVLMDRKLFFQARRNPEVRRCLREASLILPISTGIARAARFLGIGQPHRFLPFELIIRILALMERWNRSVYLLGAAKQELEKAEKNLRGSFPGLMVIGRFSGYFSRQMEPHIVLAIKKASPALLLAGDGVPGRDLWILKNKRSFNPGIFLWEGRCLNIFSGRKKHPARWLARAGLESLAGLSRRPWRVFLLFPLLFFWLLVLVARVFRSRGQKAVPAGGQTS